MPIYAYRCDDCGFEKDVLQKFADSPLTQCPQCHKPAFHRMITAPTFQLKGTGWYVTDFRGGKPGGGGGEGGDGRAADGGGKAGAGASTEGGGAPAAAGKPAAAGASGSTADTPKAS